MKTPSANNAGFSMLELTLALSIAALLSVLTVGSAINRLPGYRLDESIRQISGDMMAARSLAAAINEEVTVLFDDDGRYRVWADRNGDGTMNDQEVERHSLRFPREIDLFSYPQTLTFRPTGRLGNDISFAYIATQSNNGYKHFYIFPSGQIVWPRHYRDEEPSL